MPKHIRNSLLASLQLSSFKPDFKKLSHSFCRKLMVSVTLASLAVFCGAAAAADIDMDGIQDGVDIDDDNDGILDSVEGTLVPPTGPVASTSNYIYTAAGNPGNIGDTALYPNAGSFDGTSFDLMLTVVANSDPANLIVDINGFVQAGITYPIRLGGTPNTGTASIDFEFLISGTTTPMQVPSIYTWLDIDNNEKVTIASNELSAYQLGNPTDIAVSTVGGNTVFASSITGGPADEKRWIRTTLLSNSKFTFQYDKRTGDTGYIWDISTYTNGAAPVVLNPESFYAGDIDGDGIANSNDLDSDNDGISDLVESGTAQSNIINDADSSGSISLAEANAAMGAGLGDVDGDGLIDLFDADTTSANDLLSVGTTPVNTDGDADSDYLDLDSEADGIPDTVEAFATVGYVANDGNVADQDTDLDGVVDLFDTNDGSTNDFGGTFTQPEDTDIDGTPDYLDTDSDDDTVNDGAEIATALSPTYADPDGSVSTTLASLQNTDSDAADVDFRSLNDADGDGVPDSTDLNASDPCIPNMGGIPTTKDCDGDGNPVATDADDNTPNATDDSGAAGATIDLLSNDDYLPSNDTNNLGTTSITAIATGTTCAGTPTFNAATGTLVYASAASETSGTCALVYEVCNTSSAPGALPVCTTATVTITLVDADGDGIPDDVDSDPADACIPNASGLPGTKDCDADGNPASSDPDPAKPNAANDTGVPGTPVDLLSNDDYLPNNDPANLGTTSIVIVSAGTSCAGTPTFDATTGNMTYTPAAGEISGSCDIAYEVCNAPAGGGTPVCSTAFVTMTLADTDGDGIPDNLDSDPADACVPNASGTPGSKDCDGDGNPASNDPDPAATDASQDAGAAGNPINILANDDYLPNNDADVIGTTSITQVGGSCTGSVSLDANTGIAIYTAAAYDTDATCTVDYKVCSTSPASTMTCENATITFTIPAPAVVPDTDGDGLADDVDSAPLDACVPNTAGTPGTKDCDGDGNPASTDPDPAATDASHDAGAAGNPINILANDDYLPNNDADVIGTTSITQIGGNCIGNVSLNANNGIAIYPVDAGDTATSCTVEYEVCSASPTGTVTCENATITFAIPAPTVVPDTDGDGLTDDVDSAPTNACVPNVGGTPGNKDCDGDGNPASSDPDAANPLAANDTGSAGAPIDILANDDYLPNNNLNNTGTTTLTHVGGTCSDNVALDANTGTANYTLGADDTGANCTIVYEVCNNGSGTAVCEQAILVIPTNGSGDPAPNPTPSPTPVTDSDGDGIPDSVEGTDDTDGDGVPDYLDLDSDNDGLLDSTEMTEDMDQDGIPDYLDLDSDNDGLTDTLEAGGTDADGDGIVDDFIDNNNDGWSDNVAASRLPEPDFDGDGFVDYLDLDSDNDGLPDISESMGADWDINNDGMIDDPVDANGDGLAENINANDVQDTDQDGSPDHLDLDSNNNGTFDLVEAGGNDTDNDGTVDTWQDDDGDGIPNSVDVDFTGGVDADNDGIDDSADASILNGADTDGDGIADAFDTDRQGTGFTPFTINSPLTEQTAAGDVRIGLQGGGCTIATNNAAADPLLPGLMLLSMLFLNLRRRLSGISMRQKRPVQTMTWLVIISCALSSCSMIGTDRSNRYGNRSATVGSDSQFNRHVYAGTGIGASWLEPDTSEVPGVDVDDRVNAAGQVTLGVDVSKHFSLELHSADLGSAGLSPQGRINYHMHGGSALFYVGKNRHNHVRRGLTGYGRLGYGTLDDSSIGDVNYIENNNTHVLFGGGLEYATRSGLGLRAELISFDADAKYGQLGLIYRMGGKHRRAPVRIAKAPTPAPVPAPEPVVIEQPVAPPPITAVQVPATDPCARFNGVLEGVNFHTDSDRLTSQAETVLNGIANELAQCPTTPVAIRAHTDDQGSEQYNLGLSKRRALSVARYLSGQGVTTSRMSARAFGENSPIATNTTPEGRASNRRVELIAQ